jgi:hypothetical protein
MFVTSGNRCIAARLSSVVRRMYWRKTGAGKAISERISGAGIDICYASALL